MRAFPLRESLRLHRNAQATYLLYSFTEPADAKAPHTSGLKSFSFA
jgi:hypothetical protein